MPKNLCKRWAGDSLFCMEVTENPRRVRIIGIESGFPPYGNRDYRGEPKRRAKVHFCDYHRNQSGNKNRRKTSRFIYKNRRYCCSMEARRGSC